MNTTIPLRFFVVTFAWSWVIWAPLVLAGQGAFTFGAGLSLVTMPALFLGAFGPAVGACFAVGTLEGRPALAAFLRRFGSLRFGWRAWAAMFVVLGAVNVVAWAVPGFIGFHRPEMLLPSIAVFPIWWLAMVFLGGGQEEVGWRAYILEPLEGRFGLWGGNVVLGLVWSVWHAPLWFIPGTTQASMPFAAFTIGTIGLSFFFSWLLKAAGGRPMAGLMVHGTYNAFIAVFPTIATEADASNVRWWLHQALLLVVGALFLLHVAQAKGDGPMAGRAGGRRHAPAAGPSSSSSIVAADASSPSWR